jgi:hypothetical protein
MHGGATDLVDRSYAHMYLLVHAEHTETTGSGQDGD